MTTYATRDQARGQGAHPTDDAALDLALAAADARIDRYCGDRFLPDPSDVSRVLRVQDDGWCPSPKIVSVTSVTLLLPGSIPTSPLPATAYRVSIGGLGQVDGIQIIPGYASLGDPLIVGAEPWNGGWENLLGLAGPIQQVTVVGKFGWSAPPAEVTLAAAKIAAMLCPTPYVPMADAEGNPAGVPIGMDPRAIDRPGFEHTPASRGRSTSMVATARTTGSNDADALLYDFRTMYRVG